MLAAIPSAVTTGIEGSQVSVEVHVSNGLPGFTVVGLPDAAVRESRDRVRAAFLSSDLPWPLRRVTVNLAPSGMRKGGAGLDLPIAIGLLVASGELDPKLVTDMAFVGELGLDGSLRGVPGTVALAASLSSFRLIVPEVSVVEAHLAEGCEIHSAPTLRALVDRLCRRRPWEPAPDAGRSRGSVKGPTQLDQSGPGDLVEVKGQPLAASRPRGCCGRRPSHSVRRTAWFGKVDARQSATGSVARPRPRHGLRGRPYPLRLWHFGGDERAGPAPAFPSAPSRRIGRCDRRRRNVLDTPG